MVDLNHEQEGEGESKGDDNKWEEENTTAVSKYNKNASTLFIHNKHVRVLYYNFHVVAIACDTAFVVFVFLCCTCPVLRLLRRHVCFPLLWSFLAQVVYILYSTKVSSATASYLGMSPACRCPVLLLTYAHWLLLT